MAGSKRLKALGATTWSAWLVAAASAMAQPGQGPSPGGGLGGPGPSGPSAQGAGSPDLPLRSGSSWTSRTIRELSPETASPARVAPPGTDQTGSLADQEFARSAMAKGLVVPLDRVLQKATAFVPGDVLDVRLRARPGTPFTYEIRMLAADGRIRLVVVDATRNMVLEVRRP